MLRRVNAGDHMAAACSMDAWRKSDVGGELAIVDALVRRAAEKALYLQDLVLEAPSVFLRAKLDHAASILGAPVKYAAVPAVGSVPLTPPKAEPADVITEILKSEPATEALLLTQVVADDVIDEGEIVTAHAQAGRAGSKKRAPPCRREQEAIVADNVEKRGFFKPGNVIKVRAAARSSRSPPPKRPPQIGDPQAAEIRPRDVGNVGLFALLVFGFALLTVAGSLALNANGRPSNSAPPPVSRFRDLSQLAWRCSASAATPGAGRGRSNLSTPNFSLLVNLKGREQCRRFLAETRKHGLALLIRRLTCLPSPKQQKAAGAALSAKRGETKPSKLIGASRQMYDSMSEKQLDEFASARAPALDKPKGRSFRRGPSIVSPLWATVKRGSNLSSR